MAQVEICLNSSHCDMRLSQICFRPRCTRFIYHPDPVLDLQRWDGEFRACSRPRSSQVVVILQAWRLVKLFQQLYGKYMLRLYLFPLLLLSRGTAFIKIYFGFPLSNLILPKTLLHLTVCLFKSFKISSMAKANFKPFLPSVRSKTTTSRENKLEPFQISLPGPC